MLQAVVLCSDKKFQIIKQGDAYEFMTFFLNTIHLALNGTSKTSSSIIYKTFRGRMRQYTRKILPIDTSEEARKTLMETDEFTEKMTETPFLSLAMDLPPAPLYRDALLQNIIPQVPLGQLLTKFNGKTEKEYNTYNENFTKRFELTQLPEYLIVTYNRFRKNQWFIEKNPTIVNFSISNVDLYDCMAEDVKGKNKYTTYDLIANIVHDGKPQSVAHKGDLAVESSTYRVQVLQQGTGKWFELEDLHVKEVLPQTITLAESYIQIWRLDTKRTRTERMGESDEVAVAIAKAEPVVK
jgi:U4/U6.U5 tri-snRNP-associated protein 2